MGYETTLIIGLVGDPRKEVKLSTRPYDDGSGFHPETDENGDTAYTGRVEKWLDDYARIDLCKIGNGRLSALHAESVKAGKALLSTEFYFFYADDGNTRITEDRYGDPLHPASVDEVLTCLKADMDGSDYRRYKWAHGLLSAMNPSLSVLFYGH